MTDPNKECGYCGNIHKTKCPLVKAIEYFENGIVKRVEFMTPADHAVPTTFPPMGPQPYVPAPPAIPFPAPTPQWPIVY